jgi:D-alanyl-D-alanine carboxypeptidase (penicillin-binding protein 5/6)
MADMENVGAEGAVLWDPADQRVLWGREAEVPRPMASTTKVMTTLLAVEARTLDETVTVSQRAAALGRVPGGASLGLADGQRLPMRDLLSGLMLRSGNDAAVAVAEHVAGTESAFVARMNVRAAELGLDDTHFVNASGLTDDPRHHASPLDLARLAVVALDTEPIARWAATVRTDNPTFGVIVNRNELLATYAGATGVKTGFTSLAGQCLVASADRDGRRLISVVLDSDDHFADSAAILDHGFADWRRYSLAAGEELASLRTSAGLTPVSTSEAVGRTVAADADVATRIAWQPISVPRVAAGQAVGTLSVVVDDEVATTTPVVASTGVSSTLGRGVGEALEDGLRALARLAPVTTARPVPVQGSAS